MAVAAPTAPSTGLHPGSPTNPTQPATSSAIPTSGLTSDQSSAKGVLDTFFTTVGLTSLAAWAWDKYLRGDSIDQIMLELRQTPEYQARFPAMGDLAKRGQAISEAAYISYEQGIQSLSQRYGLPDGMYTDRESIANLLRNNVSLDEANTRASEATAAALRAPASVRQAMADQYGVGTGGLIGLYLDATKALPILERDWATSQVVGSAADAGLTGVDRATAEQLAARGIDYGAGLQGFEQVAGTAALGGGFGETANQAARVAAQFGDTGAQTQVERVRKGRLAQFAGGGGVAEGQGGVLGLGSSSTK